MTRTVLTSMNQPNAAGEFVDYLHAVREEERIALARQIHDELGGLLVSAAMDLGWAESHSRNADVLARLQRIGASLAGAIDIKRNMIERLRPTLLDNFGLFEALRWYFKHACRRTEVFCSETFPSVEVSLTPAVLSNVFRAAQTLLDCTFCEEGLKSVEIAAASSRESLSLRIGHEHVRAETVDVFRLFSNELKSTAHRIAMCRGELSFDSHDDGAQFNVCIPLRPTQAT